MSFLTRGQEKPLLSEGFFRLRQCSSVPLTPVGGYQRTWRRPTPAERELSIQKERRRFLLRLQCRHPTMQPSAGWKCPRLAERGKISPDNLEFALKLFPRGAHLKRPHWKVSIPKPRPQPAEDFPCMWRDNLCCCRSSLTRRRCPSGWTSRCYSAKLSFTIPAYWVWRIIVFPFPALLEAAECYQPGEGWETWTGVWHVVIPKGRATLSEEFCRLTAHSFLLLWLIRTVGWVFTWSINCRCGAVPSRPVQWDEM